MKKIASNTTAMELTTFTNGTTGSIRAGLDGDGRPWVVGIDLSRLLGLTSRSSLAALDADEKGVRTVDTLGGPQQLTIVYESGVWDLVLKSRRPEAHEVRRWICHDVLPTLRERGWYAVRDAQTPPHHGALPPRFLDAEGSMSVTEASRVVATVCEGFRRKDAFSLMRQHRLIERQTNAPTMLGIRRGLVVPMLTTHTNSDGRETLNGQYARLTSKGLGWLIARAMNTAEELRGLEADGSMGSPVPLRPTGSTGHGSHLT